VVVSVLVVVVEVVMVVFEVVVVVVVVVEKLRLGVEMSRCLDLTRCLTASVKLLEGEKGGRRGEGDVEVCGLLGGVGRLFSGNLARLRERDGGAVGAKAG